MDASIRRFGIHNHQLSTSSTLYSVIFGRKAIHNATDADERTLELMYVLGEEE